MKSRPASSGMEKIRWQTRILYGDGIAREPEDESIDVISKRLVSGTPIPLEPAALLQSPFIQEFMSRHASLIKRMAESKVIEAEVVESTDKSVLLDLSPGSGFLDASEAQVRTFRPGGRIWVAAVGEGDRSSVYSVRLAGGRLSLNVIESSWAGGMPVDGIPVDRTGVPGSGGWTVDVEGFPAALPDEESGPPGLQIGGSARFYIVHYDPVSFCVILSRKKFLNVQTGIQHRRAFERFKPGDIVDGKVASVSASQALVDLGGILAELSGEDAGHGPPSENLSALSPGQPLRLFVLETSSNRISVGIRQLYPDPWAFVKKSIQEGARVKGVVHAVHSDRLMVQLQDGVIGEIPWTEAAWQFWDPARLADQFRPGDEVESICISIQRELRKIVLSIKCLQPDPLPDIQKRYPVGARCEIKLVAKEDTRAKVTTDEGFLGVILPDDLSWTGTVSPKQFFQHHSSRVLAEVLSVDPQTRLIRFGVKQARPDPFMVLVREIEVGKRYAGHVVKNIPAGSLVEIRKGLVGLLRKTEYAGDEPPPAEGVGIEVMVTGIQPQQHRIALSRRAIAELEEKQDMQMFLSEGKPEHKVSMKDLMPGDIFKQIFEKRKG